MFENFWIFQSKYKFQNQQEREKTEVERGWECRLFGISQKTKKQTKKTLQE